LVLRGMWPSQEGKNGLLWGITIAWFLIFWFAECGFGVMWLGTWPMD
jgi:hypothetical protein